MKFSDKKLRFILFYKMKQINVHLFSKTQGGGDAKIYPDPVT